MVVVPLMAHGSWLPMKNESCNLKIPQEELNHPSQKLKTISSCFLLFWFDSFSEDKFFECPLCRKVSLITRNSKEAQGLEAFYCENCVSSGKKILCLSLNFLA
jgi:hypothetical protein